MNFPTATLIRSLATCAILIILSSPAAAQALSEALIAEAMKDVKAKTFERVQIGINQYEIVIVGPLGRIARAAQLAERELKPFTRTDVTDDMLAPMVRISVWPDKPTDMRYVPPPVSNIVIMPKGVTDVSKAIQPIKKESVPQEWGNALGAKVASEAMIADFNLDDLPAGEFDIVVGCACRGGPPRATVKAKDRQKIR